MFPPCAAATAQLVWGEEFEADGRLLPLSELPELPAQPDVEVYRYSGRRCREDFRRSAASSAASATFSFCLHGRNQAIGQQQEQQQQQ